MRSSLLFIWIIAKCSAKTNGGNKVTHPLEHTSPDGWASLFSHEIAGNVLGGIYAGVNAATRSFSDELIIKPYGIFWFKQNREVGRIEGPIPSVSYRSLLHEALRVDTFLQKHLTIILDTEEEVRINLVD